ncbi:LysR family transcriptional regulator [Permianibacter sp. IMCC34836]|uniref:LysR family transcriptional regulator n=1 Tax=Permianibacter fluminis TaxID=2738515 RepID=UPI001557A765|nr:LysR family transcriptional regulator [Permianibacter fluminis]NQD37723.1 LysR family transcriptional regulator [Permianibacter fluminis]
MSNPLFSRQLEAFFAVGRHLHFGKAADEVCLSQSALSHRISTLEEQLQTKLFLRLPEGVSLTQAGQRLMRFCLMADAAEEELLSDLGATGKALRGVITIAGFSSVMRSVVLPALTALIHANPEARLHFIWDEVAALPDLLFHGKTDFVISPSLIERPGYEAQLLGHERNVLIESQAASAIRDVYLDHEQGDHFSEQFLHRHDGSSDKPISRAYYMDIYGILDGVSRGLGRGVVPLHLVTPALQLKLADGYDRAWATPVLLQYQRQPYYTRLHQAVADCLLANAGPLLQQNHCDWTVHDFT